MPIRNAVIISDDDEAGNSKKFSSSFYGIGMPIESGSV
jgi:hypothetical protein